MSINNWNENRKNNIESVIILKNLKSELVEDLSTMNERIASLERRKDCSDYLYQLISDKNRGIELDSSDIGICLMRVGYIYKFAPSFAVYNEILSSSKLSLIKSDSIKKFLANYKSQVQENARVEAPYEITLKNFEKKSVNYLSEIPLTKKIVTIERYKIGEFNIQKLSKDEEMKASLRHISYITSVELELKRMMLVPKIKLLIELIDNELEL